MTPRRVHGGPDALGAPAHDFSTNSNACGPCPGALKAVQAADVCRYPDASHAALRAQLAAFHGVEVGRVCLAGSASEFIGRLTTWVAQCSGGQGVWVPPHAYGDYAQAAHARGVPLVLRPDNAVLVWACEPSSPLGQAHANWPHTVVASNPGAEPTLSGQVCVLDSAYAPLRLSGSPSLAPDQLARVWQLWSPNKALGLTGVRAAYAIAPLGAAATVLALDELAPSWPVGAHGVAMLQAWVRPEVQAWLQASLVTLRAWKSRQIAMLEGLGWTVLPSEANFFCAQSPHELDLFALRDTHGIKLRDATSFGLPGWVRLGVLGPGSQDALRLALAFG